MDKRTGGAGALFTMVGTVVGAGFVSGRELLQFFGSFRLSLVCMAGLLFFAGFFLFVRLGKKFGGFEGAMKGAFGKFGAVREGGGAVRLLRFLRGDAVRLQRAAAAGGSFPVPRLSRRRLSRSRAGHGAESARSI